MLFPDAWHVLLQIVLRTGVIYLVVLIGVRLSGKREVGQMTPFDLTLLLLLSNSVQNAMTGPDTSLMGGVAAACTLLLLNYLVANLSGVNRRFRKMVEGQPSLLVHDGKVIDSHMAKEHVSMDELHRALREHGIAGCHDVALAVLEVDGSISCLKYDEIKPDANTHLARRKGHPEKIVTKSNWILPAVSLAQDNRYWLVVGLNDYAHGATVLEISQSHGEAYDHGSLYFLAGLQLVFGSESRLRILLQRRKSLIVATEVNGGNRVATGFSSGCHKLALDAMNPQ